ncbi:hypothetical protein ACQ4PT_034834 [Festuca glaucescens]
MNCGGSRGPAATVRCRECSTNLTAAPGARAVHCMQCNCGTRVPGSGRQVVVVPPPRHNPGFGVCRSKKRAVLIGIKYTGRRASELRGPINDVKCMKHLLTTRFGFPSEGIIILTDEETNKCRLPTKENIRMAMHWLVQGCSNGDSLVFQFSGIGTQVPDEDGDERDCMDEALCPMDSFHQGPILDDEINAAIVRPLVHGAKLHALVDAHHSATVLDLPYQCITSKTTGCLNWVKQPTPNGACKGTSGGRAVLISGSSGGKKMPANTLPEPCATMGALTHSFIKALECEPRASYGRLLTSMRTIMRQGGPCSLQGPVGSSVRKVTNFSGVEAPCLSSSENFGIDCEKLCI